MLLEYFIVLHYCYYKQLVKIRDKVYITAIHSRGNLTDNVKISALPVHFLFTAMTEKKGRTFRTHHTLIQRWFRLGSGWGSALRLMSFMVILSWHISLFTL